MVHQGMLISKNIEEVIKMMTGSVSDCRRNELAKIGELDEDAELLLKYLAVAHEALERKSDLLSQSVRGVDVRDESIPQIAFLVQKFMVPILRDIVIDYDALADLGQKLNEQDDEDIGDGIGGLHYNYKNADKIRFIKWVREGKIKVSGKQMLLIDKLVVTARYLSEIVYSDSIVDRVQAWETEWGAGDKAGRKQMILDAFCEEFG